MTMLSHLKVCTKKINNGLSCVLTLEGKWCPWMYKVTYYFIFNFLALIV